jgi:hypothetical protein
LPSLFTIKMIAIRSDHQIGLRRTIREIVGDEQNSIA